MNDERDFQSMLQFLDNFAPSVTGRSAPITEKLRETINRFAKGALSSEERAAAAAEILQNQKAIELLAQEIRDPA